jgi:hypothetical protein
VNGWDGWMDEWMDRWMDGEKKQMRKFELLYIMDDICVHCMILSTFLNV